MWRKRLREEHSADSIHFLPSTFYFRNLIESITFARKYKKMEKYIEHAHERIKASRAVKVLILLALALAGVVLCSLLLVVTGVKINHQADMYSGILFQDVLVFIAPALATMAICYFKPLRVMGLTTAPSWRAIVAVVMVCMVSLPAMNWIVDWNEGVKLPRSLAALEQAMRAMEDAAQAVTTDMLSGIGVGKLLANLVIVAFMAGLSEEIFFRGALLKILLSNHSRIHLCIWVAAIVFSAMHMQFYGFVPRMLLGAWFGYLLWWTRSLWVPIIAHALNNSIVVVSTWLESRGIIDAATIDDIGLVPHGTFPVMAFSCAILTVLLIIMVSRWIDVREKAEGESM